jgi:N-succinyldiaminopimelate aminotransferase
VAIAHDLVVVTDEVYEHLTFDEEHVPLATLPGMFERTVSISSAGKTFSLTGWKVGWASGPAPLVAAVEGAKNWLSYSSGAPLQPAVAVALDEHDAFHEALAKDLREKRDHLCAGLAALGMRVHQPSGTYFVTTDVSAYGHVDGRAFCLALPQAAGVVAIPAQVFYDDLDEGRHLVRWAFCKRAEVIDEGLRRLGAGDLRAR